MNKVQKYLNETVAELKKMTWPSREEMISSTIITVVFSLVVSIFIGIVDWFLGAIVRSIFTSGV